MGPGLFYVLYGPWPLFTVWALASFYHMGPGLFSVCALASFYRMGTGFFLFWVGFFSVWAMASFDVIIRLFYVVRFIQENLYELV